MKNFDSEWEQRKSEDARSFTVGGETFVLKKAVRPESLALRDDIDEDSPLKDSMEAIDGLLLSMIEPDNDAEARYRKLREADDTLGMADIREVLDWAIEMQTGRPPTLPSASSAGRGRTATRSTAASSSRALSAA